MLVIVTLASWIGKQINDFNSENLRLLLKETKFQPTIISNWLYVISGLWVIDKIYDDDF
jgi:hypothetical protein